ncbi:DNA topoisomerase II [Rhizopus microsporus ATCC 52813]|uniref:DNA topoisomerase 2 n=1 Tax=Rhizopus microsporus ATCC 52813 TaxID=1340429 RepID=A0A2G4T398_RHIZD|nr:DNA topoisomerase II [Rhizopus microsporus ATCC 52813]PHZ15501.1 DNA topoisomerase II [Rhizopus microsporus ATCC 52813]
MIDVSNSPNKNKSIEEIYQKKSQLEHILLRPDTYVGSTEVEEEEMWVFDSEQSIIKKKKIKYVPGLYKIVDEILVNAADHKIRDPAMTYIKVTINRTENFICIENNGKGIPITEHKKEKVYVPELIFGHLLTSSNYDDEEKRVVGGRNGYGAKLCNVFSTEFTIETADKERQLKYKQIFQKNMTVIKPPSITKNSRGEQYTRISFKPDLAKFSLSEMDEDFEALIKKRVYDLAGCVDNCNVFLNGTKIPVKNFKQYCELYTKSLELGPEETKKEIIFDNAATGRWQVCFALSDGQFDQISFVNSICTAKGGTHVNHVADQIVKHLAPEVEKKSKNKNVKNMQIKNHMILFIKCLVENPTFETQTKETMTLRASAFGSSYKLSDRFANAIAKSGIVDNIVRWVKFKEEQKMSKVDKGLMRRTLNIPKLEDANFAGVPGKNKRCTLIITEGDSAKSLVLSGMSVVGRDYYGVFPIRGKLLNVRDVSNAELMKNEEIKNIKAILGLQHGKKYESVDELRYGRLMIMTDQDHDGSHIKGLIINFIDSMFPSLLDIPGFLLEFITPIIKCTHKRSKQIVSFFTIPEYEQWALEHNKKSEWDVKYFKGLGTSDKMAAREYFSKPEIHQKEFQIMDTEDRQLIDMVFNKKKASDRKEWLTQYEPGIFIDHNVNKIKISEFVNRELMLFSMADNIRSIPSVVDGFKPAQRKVLYGCIKRPRNTEVKVAQLANYVAGITQYHHGEQSVAGTIINMAQNFVGSNNINLLVPSGQFGNRHSGSKSAASPRYLFTRLSKVTRLIFHPDDDAVLNYLIEEDKMIEPSWYIPIIPMVLVNGADGIGTGWSTAIPNYNPKDIIDNILRLMNNQPMETMKPWYRGFKGEISPSGPSKFTVNGIAEVTPESDVKVTEIPVRLYTEAFKKFLMDSLPDQAKDKKNIISFKDNSTDVAVDFTIKLDDSNLKKAEDVGLLTAFKITSTINTTNIVCFDKNGKIKRYDGPEEILREFYDLRLEFYAKRKEHLITVLKHEYERLDNKAKFIQLVIDEKLQFFNRKKADVIADMKEHGLQQIYPLKRKNALVQDDDEDPNNQAEEQEGTGYEYLFSISVSGFTREKVEELHKQRDTKLEELEDIQGTPPKTFWRRDLEALLKEWESILEEDAEYEKTAKPMATSDAGKKRKRAPVKKKVKQED